MTTHYLDHLAAFTAEAGRILDRAEIKQTPQSDEARALEAEEAAAMIMQLSGCMDRLMMNILGEADEEIGAMSDTERRDSFQIVTDATEGNWDWPFKRFAASVWNALPIGAPYASERLSARQMGVQTGRAA
jgi:hypothetical protein